MKKVNICLVTLLFFGMAVWAQETPEESRWNLKAGYSRQYHVDWDFKDGNIGEFSIEGNYRFFRLLQGGVYFGYTNAGRYDAGMNSCAAFSYGINANFRIFPLLAGDNNSKFDVYLMGKFGGYSVDDEESITIEDGPVYENSGLCGQAGLGVDYRMFERFGLFAEYVTGFGEGNFRDPVSSYSDPVKKNISFFKFGVSAYF